MCSRKTVAVLGLVMMFGCLTACGAKEKNVSASETDKDQNSNEKQVIEINKDSDNNQTFGLKDFEGFYYKTDTEEMDGYNVTYTYGYQFNGDGTGTYYGQDNIEITWNETEIHCADNVYNYDMEPGKLTVHMEQGFDEVYEKLKGKFIKPNPYNIDVNNVSDGIYPAYFTSEDISEADGTYTITVTLFTEDTYDIVDIGQMASGDIILVDGQLFEVKTIDTSDTGFKDINGGIEEGGASLRSVEESNCYVYAGFNDMTTYTNQGRANIEVGNDVKLTDDSDPTASKEYTGAEAMNQLRILTDNYSISEYSCRLLVEGGEITEITRMYTP